MLRIKKLEVFCEENNFYVDEYEVENEKVLFVVDDDENEELCYLGLICESGKCFVIGLGRDCFMSFDDMISTLKS